MGGSAKTRQGRKREGEGGRERKEDELEEYPS